MAGTEGMSETESALLSSGYALANLLLAHGLTDQYLLSNQSSLKIASFFRRFFQIMDHFVSTRKTSDGDVGTSRQPTNSTNCSIN
jgi:hypothetical protein